MPQAGDWLAPNQHPLLVATGGVAPVHPAAHALHYGTGVFEGIRAYDSKTGTNIFRLEPGEVRVLSSTKGGSTARAGLLT